MIESKKINSNVATSVADSDLVIVSGSSGCLKPITFANLMNAVRSGIQIGGRNLVLNSRQQKNIYPSATYEFSNALEIGKQYTITACLTIPEGATQTVVSLNGSSFYNRLYLGAGNTCTKKIFSRTVTLTHASQTCFCLCDTNGAKCHWVMVTEGNIATAWTPAPEDDWGGYIKDLQPLTNRKI